MPYHTNKKPMTKKPMNKKPMKKPMKKSSKLSEKQMKQLETHSKKHIIILAF